MPSSTIATVATLATAQPPWAAEARGARSGESSLRLSGLHCAACAGLIEEAVGAVDGVLGVVVNAASLRATVRWDPARTSPEAVVDAVRRAGYGAAPDTTLAARELRRGEARAALWRLFVAGFCAMQVMMLAAPAYVAAPGDIVPDLERLLGWGAWLMSLPVLLFSAAPFFSGAWRALRQRRIGMDVPVALGIAVTFIASTAAAFAPGGVFGGEMYFDSLTMFISFLLLGRWFEMRLRHRAAEALEAATGAMPETALRVGAGGVVEAVAMDQLAVGDALRVPVGAAFAADGVVLEGESEADESLLSGESRPVHKAIGSYVVGGSVNLGAPLLMRVLRCGADTRYEAIVALMHDAATQRPASSRWADRWAAPFLWAVLLLAALAAAVWSVLDPPRAVWVAVSVLIVTCPCALSLATPSALLAAAQALARRGVLLRRLDALETLAGIDRLFLDKTGTLTAQRPHYEGMTRLRAADAEEDADRAALAKAAVMVEADADAAHADATGNAAGRLEEWDLLRIAASLAAWSRHPLSQALCEAAPLASAGAVWNEVQEQPGAGIQARDADGRLWRLGAAAWAGGPVSVKTADENAAGNATENAAENAAMNAEDSTGPQVFLSRDGTALASFHFDESLAEGVAQALAELRADGVALSLLSGDAPARVRRLARRLGIDNADAIGGATPEAKLREVALAQARGESVGMVGDGINDAPVLARADVSLAMGEGALVARANADAVIVSNRLGDLVQARALAQRMLSVIRQNIAWAAAYNAVCVPLALLGALPPWAAGLGMAASSLFVVGNSLRLQRG